MNGRKYRRALGLIFNHNGIPGGQIVAPTDLPSRQADQLRIVVGITLRQDGDQCRMYLASRLKPKFAAGRKIVLMQCILEVRSWI